MKRATGRSELEIRKIFKSCYSPIINKREESRNKKMANTKIAGYILAIAGLGVIALSSMISKMLSFLGAKATIYTIVGGVALIVLGVVLVLAEGGFGGKPKQAEEEVPIYEGTGKKRKIVGYRKAG